MRRIRSSSLKRLPGWTAGAGIEWKVAPNWSVKLEYLHFDFASNNSYNLCSNVTLYECNGVSRKDGDLTAETVKVGVNYFFNSEPYPLPYK